MTTQLELERALCRELGINALDRDAVDYIQFFDFSTLKQMAKSVIGENRRSPIAVCAFPTWEEVGRGRQRTGFVGIMSTVERCVAPAMAVRPSTGRRSVFS
jgi:hypothetical protein